jgi:hypothetical protein
MAHQQGRDKQDSFALSHHFYQAECVPSAVEPVLGSHFTDSSWPATVANEHGNRADRANDEGRSANRSDDYTKNLSENYVEQDLSAGHVNKSVIAETSSDTPGFSDTEIARCPI